jgi:hypothetical protein
VLVKHDDAWYARQLAHCENVLEHNAREHTEQEREAARKQLENVQDGRREPEQQRLNLAA